MRTPLNRGVRGVAAEVLGPDEQQYTTADSSLKQQAAALLTILREEYPVLAEFKPLAIGIHVALRRVGVSNKLLSRALAKHCGQRRYLQALAAGGARFALDGTACGEVTEEQQERAKQQLIERSAKPAKTKAPPAAPELPPNPAPIEKPRGYLPGRTVLRLAKRVPA